MIELYDLYAIFSWLLIYLIIQFSTYAVLHSLIPKLSLPLSFATGPLVFMFISWYLSFFGFPPKLAIFFILIPGLIFLLYNYKSIFFNMKDELHYYLIFSVVFISFLVFKFFLPDTNFLDNFADFGFIASIALNPVVPPLDAWVSGKYINYYYYLGHWLMAMLGISANISTNYFYNLCIPTIAGIVSVNMFAIGKLVIKRFALLPVIAFFFINPALIFNIISGLLSDTDVFNIIFLSSRVIPSEINEYPLLSLFLSQVHANVTAFISQSLMILLITCAIMYWKELDNKGQISLTVICGICLASLPCIHSWDVIVWAPVVLITGLFLIKKSLNMNLSEILKDDFFQSINNCYKKLKEDYSLKNSFFFLIGTPLIGLLIASQFLFGMDVHRVSGISIVTNASPIVPYLLVHGFFFICIIFSLRAQILKFPWIFLLLIIGILTAHLSVSLSIVLLIFVLYRHRDIGDFFVACGLGIIILTEFFFLEEIADLGRSNTVFKLGLCAWILLGTGSAIMIGEEIKRYISRLEDKTKTWFNETKINRILSGIFIIILLILPVSGFLIGLPYTPTLNGHAWISEVYDEDAKAIKYLQTLPPGHIIIEASDYSSSLSYFSRISSMTGIPTIMGWTSYVMLHRGDEDMWIEKRLLDVKMIYESPNMTIPLMKKYGADLLYVGLLEQQTYLVDLPQDGLKLIYDDETVKIFELV